MYMGSWVFGLVGILIWFGVVGYVLFLGTRFVNAVEKIADKFKE